MKKANVFVALVLLMGCAATVFAAENDWLIGKWELVFDSANTPKDWLEFGAEGKATSITPDGRRIPGRFSVTEKQINVTYSFNGKMIPMVLKFSPEKDTIIVYAEKTKTTSLYRKVKQ